MNAIKSFFSKDNATAKLSGWLIHLTTLATLAGQYFNFSPRVYLLITLFSATIAVAAQFLKANPVVSKSLWLNLLYTVVVYVADRPEITQLWPDAQKFIAFTGAAVKLFTPFTTQSPSDPKPPTADPLTK